MRISKKRKIRPSLLALLILIIIVLILYPLVSHLLHPTKYIYSDEHILSITQPVMTDGEISEQDYQIPRGTKVVVESRGETSSTVAWNDQTIEISNDNLKDSLQECVDFEYVYPRKLVNLREEKGGKLTDTVAAKGEALKVLSISASDLDPETGEVAWVEVEKDGQSYYLSGMNLEMTEENATKTYIDNLTYNPIYDSVFGEGYSKKAYLEDPDYRGNVQPDFADNPRIDNIQAVCVNYDVAKENFEYLKNIKDTTPLNAIVITLKWNEGKVVYESDTVKEYYKNPADGMIDNPDSMEEAARLIKKYKDAGFYVIGRMETFADSSLAFEHPEWAITGKDGKPFDVNDYWVSAYVRDTWEYNVSLAKEFANLGVNEVQFDFVRFPDDGTFKEADGTTNYHNQYGESKVGAIQGFLFYAREELEPLHVYVAADMYGGPITDINDYDIGQYYPAIAVAANVVNPMVYLDHFNLDYPEEEDTGDENHDTMSWVMKLANQTIEPIENPGTIRFWIQGYGGISNEELQSQIRGMVDGGGEGWMMWTDRGDPSMVDPVVGGMVETGSADDPHDLF